MTIRYTFTLDDEDAANLSMILNETIDNNLTKMQHALLNQHEYLVDQYVVENDYIRSLIAKINGAKVEEPELTELIRVKNEAKSHFKAPKLP